MRDLDGRIREKLWADITGPVGERSRALFAVLDQCKEFDSASEHIGDEWDFAAGQIREAIARELGIEEGNE